MQDISYTTPVTGINHLDEALYGIRLENNKSLNHHTSSLLAHRCKKPTSIELADNATVAASDCALVYAKQRISGINQVIEAVHGNQDREMPLP